MPKELSFEEAVGAGEPDATGQPKQRRTLTFGEAQKLRPAEPSKPQPAPAPEESWADYATAKGQQATDYLTGTLRSANSQIPFATYGTAGANYLRKKLSGEPADFESERQAEVQRQREFERLHPTGAIAGRTAGLAAGLPLMMFGGPSKTPAEALAKATLESGSLGWLYGAGTGNHPIEDSLTEGGKGAAVGAALGAAPGTAGYLWRGLKWMAKKTGVANATGLKALGAASEEGGEAVARDVAGRILREAAGERGVPEVADARFVPGVQPTVGQATANPGLLSVERAVRNASPEAAALHREYNAANTGAMREAIDSLGDAANPNPGAAVRNGLEASYDTLHKREQTAWNTPGLKDVPIKTDQLSQAIQGYRGGLTGPMEDRIPGDVEKLIAEYVPQATRAAIQPVSLGELSSFEALLQRGARTAPEPHTLNLLNNLGQIVQKAKLSAARSDGAVNPMEFMQDLQGFKQGLNRYDQQLLPPEILEAVNNYAPVAQGRPGLSVGELTDFASRLREAASNAWAKDDRKTAKVTGDLQRIVNQHLSNPETLGISEEIFPAVAEKLAAAKNASREKAELFRQPAEVRQTLAQDRYGAEKVDDSGILGKVLRPVTTPGAREDFNAFLRALDRQAVAEQGPAAPQALLQARQAIRDDFTSRLLRAGQTNQRTLDDELSLNLPAIVKFLDQHPHVANSPLFTPDQRTLLKQVRESALTLSQKLHPDEVSGAADDAIKALASRKSTGPLGLPIKTTYVDAMIGNLADRFRTTSGLAGAGLGQVGGLLSGVPSEYASTAAALASTKPAALLEGGIGWKTGDWLLDKIYSAPRDRVFELFMESTRNPDVTRALIKGASPGAAKSIPGPTKQLISRILGVEGGESDFAKSKATRAGEAIGKRLQALASESRQVP